MRILLFACICFGACSPGSRSVAKKEKNDPDRYYPYSCVYKNVGYVSTHSKKKNH